MKKEDFTPIRWIEILFGIGFLALLLSLLMRGEFLEGIVYDFGHFADFFDHIRRFYLGLENVYEEGMHACFPPLAYCLYALAAKILRLDNAGNPDGLGTSGSGLLLLSMLTALFAALFLLAFLRPQNAQRRQDRFLAVLLLGSYPFWLAVERGNMSLLVLLLLMYAMSLRDSDRAAERELALILIAVAAALKLYPAIFGVLYLAEKRYKDALRLLAYGILFFFVPFVFFDGAVGFRIFLHNLTAVGSGATGVTIVGICGRIGEQIGIGLARGHDLGKAAAMVYFTIALWVCFRNKKSWRTVAALTSLMIVFVAASGSYCLIYWAIPFRSFLDEMEGRKQYRKMDYLYAVLFAGVFFAYPVRTFGSSGILYLVLYLMIAVLLLEHAVCVGKELRNGIVNDA